APAGAAPRPPLRLPVARAAGSGRTPSIAARARRIARAVASPSERIYNPGTGNGEAAPRCRPTRGRGSRREGTCETTVENREIVLELGAQEPARAPTSPEESPPPKPEFRIQ